VRLTIRRSHSIEYFINVTTMRTILGLALAAALAPASPAEGYGPKVGQRHADFTLADIHTGKPTSLSDFRGKKVLLIQFASW
jgi:hypothetical protein